MDNYIFKITNVMTEKGINGITIIEAECIQDGISLGIKILNSQRNKRDFIKDKLNRRHEQILKLKCEINNNTIQVGEILK